MRNRYVILLLSISLLLFFTACSKDEITLEDRFDTYVAHWIEQDFTSMYDMLSEETLETYAPEDFIDRYNKIYEDLHVSELNVTFDSMAKDDLETAVEKEQATIPFTVNMETVAGPITFDYEATLIQQGEEDNKDWFIEWDPGFIFPPMKDGGEIGFQTDTPRRGEILDRNQMPLAINDIVYEVGVVPENLEANSEQEKRQIAEWLNISVEAIDEELNAGWVKPDSYVPLGQVPKTNDTVVKELSALDSVQVREVTGRVYPAGEAAGHIIGYVGSITAEELENRDPEIYGPNDIVGKYGLERIFDEQLKGERGIKITVSQEVGDDIVLAEKEVKDGENIQLTLDVNIQEELYKAYDDKAGTAAAIHPKTGETLALVSSPAFDPNELVYGNTQRITKELEEDPRLPLINRFAATFAPGSALKPITAAVGINNGTLDPNEGLEIKGLTWDNGEGWGDYQVRRVSQTDQPVDLADALIRSDNIYFAMQAVDMGIDSFVSGFEAYGFGEEIPFTYPLTESTISSTGEIDNEVLLANTSYGQGEIEVSSLHLAVAYTPFLNNGDMIKPTLLIDDDTEQVWKEQLISSDDAKLIKDILSDVVMKGTASTAKRDELKISGKTGTAELKLSSDEAGEENGWFVGYPTDDEDILIAMMIEGVEDLGGSGYPADKVADVLIEIKK